MRQPRTILITGAGGFIGHHLVNGLVDIVAAVAGKTIRKRYNLTRPQGVRGRNSDNTRLRQILGWEPRTTLEEGLGRTYRWIAGQIQDTRATAPEAMAAAV